MLKVAIVSNDETVVFFVADSLFRPKNVLLNEVKPIIITI